MKVAIMQPYFMPYIGYFQLINAVDVFVIYDNIEFTKKGWINRNRMLVNKKDDFFTLPLNKDSDYLTIKERYLADSHKRDILKIIRKIDNSYRNAPYYKDVFPMVKNVLLNVDLNLFNYIQFSLKTILKYLEIKTEIIVASDIAINHSLKSQDKVLAICKNLSANNYINSIGGITLYAKEDFIEENIALSFLKSDEIIYKQFDNDFISSLSIIDVMMFNSKIQIKKYLNSYTFI